MCVKPRKSKVSGFALPLFFAVFGSKPFKFKQVHLCIIQRQFKCGQSFTQLRTVFVGVELMLEANHSVVRMQLRNGNAQAENPRGKYQLTAWGRLPS